MPMSNNLSIFYREQSLFCQERYFLSKTFIISWRTTVLSCQDHFLNPFGLPNGITRPTYSEGGRYRTTWSGSQGSTSDTGSTGYIGNNELIIIRQKIYLIVGL